MIPCRTKAILLRKQVDVIIYRDPLDPKWFIAEAIVEGHKVVDQGRSIEEAIEHIREAIELLLEYLHGLPDNTVEVEIVPYVKDISY